MTSNEMTCPKCNGSGVKEKREYYSDGHTGLEDIICSNCGGKGTVEEQVDSESEYGSSSLEDEEDNEVDYMGYTKKDRLGMTSDEFDAWTGGRDSWFDEDYDDD